MKQLFFFIFFSGWAMSNYPVNDHYDGEKFYNTPKTSNKSLFTVLKWRFTSKRAVWPTDRVNKIFPATDLGDKSALVTWVNHASFLVRLKGLNVLTDPQFSKRASPFTFIGPQRVRAPGMSIDQLPGVDVVVVSHNHYDHLDLASLKLLDEKFHPLFLIPLGDKKLLQSVGITHIKEMDWYQTEVVNNQPITFLPAQHWSARWINDKNKSLWGSYMIGKDFKVYFAGDTGYGSHFRKIKERAGAPDVALLPIGAYEPRWFMKEHHMNPEDAVMAHKDLGARKSIGMHFGTFQLTDEGIDAPLEALKEAKQKLSLTSDDFVTLDIGETIAL